MELWEACKYGLLPFYEIFGKPADWGFSQYFDDHFNWKQFPETQTLGTYSWKQFLFVLSHKGLNVFEPIGNLLKAIEIDTYGPDPHALRLVTLATHLINTVLLSCWLILLTSEERARKGISKLTSWSVIALISLWWCFHPLHAELLGWLSAQNYTFALLFSLLSCIQLELAIRAHDARKVLFGAAVNTGLSVLFYCCACMCKAPAVVVPIVHIARLLIEWWHRSHSMDDASTRNFISFTGDFTFLVSLSMAMCLNFAMSANLDSVSHYPEFQSVLGLIIGSIFRAGLTIYSALGRTIAPVLLSCHYVVPLSLRELYLVPEYLSAKSISASHVATLMENPQLSSVLGRCVGSCTLLGLISIICVSSTYFNGNNILLLGWVSYLILWAPTCGIMQHGQEHLGLDRYNYFPLALGFTPFLWSIVCGLVESSSSSSKGSKHRKLKLVFLVVFAAPVLMWYTYSGNHYLHLWRNDQFLLENCVHVDNDSQECHYWLAEHYGFHEKNFELSTIHREEALKIARRNPSQNELLFSAHILFQMKNSNAACKLVNEAYALGESSRGLQKQAHNNYAMAVNDQILCHNLQNMSTSSVTEAIQILYSLLNEGSLRPKVAAKIQFNLRNMELWLVNGSPFEAKFLY
jgi:hypothetical protein